MDSDAVRDWCFAKLRIFAESGDEVICECPWCTSDRLYVNTTGVFICFKCNQKGPAIKLVAKVEGIPYDKAKILLDSPFVPDEDDLLNMLVMLNRRAGLVEEKKIYHPLPREFIPCFDGELWRLPEYVTNDLPEGRALEDKTILEHGLGYAECGRYSGRLIVPIIGAGHHTFIGRYMGRHSIPYLTQKKGGLGELLYWQDRIEERADIVLVEGVFDKMRMTELGYEDVCGGFGKNLTHAQIKQLRKLRPKSLTFFYDADAKAYAFADAAICVDRLRCEVFVALCEGDDDPDEIGFRDGRRGIDRALDVRRHVQGPLDALEGAINAL